MRVTAFAGRSPRKTMSSKHPLVWIHELGNSVTRSRAAVQDTISESELHRMRVSHFEAVDAQKIGAGDTSDGLMPLFVASARHRIWGKAWPDHRKPASCSRGKKCRLRRLLVNCRFARTIPRSQIARCSGDLHSERVCDPSKRVARAWQGLLPGAPLRLLGVGILLVEALW